MATDLLDQVHTDQQTAAGDLLDQTHAESDPRFYAEATAQALHRSVGGFMSNVVKSGVGMAKNLATAVVHPVRTVEGVADLAAGGLNKVGEEIGVLDPHREKLASDREFDAFLSDVKNRYGGFDNFVTTLYDDPVGALGDVSLLAGGGAATAGKLAKLADLAKLTRTANMARTVEGVVSTAAKFSDPVYLATQPVAAGFDAAKGSMARNLYESALKPNKRLDLPEYKQTVETGLREGLNPGRVESYDKLKGLIDGVRKEIDTGIQARTGAPVIDPADVAQRVDAMRGKFATVNPVDDLRDIDRAKSEFLQQFQPPAPKPSGLLGPNGQPLPAPPAPPARKLTLADAQDMKTKTNATLKGEYGSQSQASVEAQKALVRGLKEEIEKIFPEIGGLNKREAELLNLEPSLEAAIKRTGSKDVIPSGAGDYAVVLKKILDRPKTKAAIAMALERAPDLAPSKGVRVGQRMALVTSRLQSYLDDIKTAQR